MMGRSTQFVVVLAVAAVAWCCAVAAGQPNVRGPVEAAARLPRNADVVVLIDNAGKIRASDSWRALEAALGRFAPIAAAEVDPGNAWGALAKTLGWTEDETFDRLLGTRAALVIRHGRKEGEASRWALLSWASLETDRRLRERLRAAPRGIVNDHQVLAVEGGNYELTTHREGGGGGRGEGWGGGGGGGELPVRLILGPAGEPELFDELIAIVAGAEVGGKKAELLEGTPVIAAARQLGGGQADWLLLLRIDGAEGEAGEKLLAENRDGGWDRFLAVACRQEKGGGWTADLTMRDGAQADGLRAIPVTSDAAFRSLAKDSLVVMTETRLKAGEEGDGAGSPVTRLLDQLGVPTDLQGVLGDRQAVVVRAESTSPGAGLLCALALDTTDAVAMTRHADQFVATMVGSIEEMLKDDRVPTRPVPDFHALAPEAVRVLPVDLEPGAATAVVSAVLLGGRSKDEVGAGSPGRPVVAWLTRANAGDAGGKRPGWCVVAVGADGRDGTADGGDAPKMARLVGDALRDEAQATTARRRWISTGQVRPAAIERALSKAIPDVGSWRGLVRGIDEVTWGIWATDEGEVRGRIGVTLPPVVEAPVRPSADGGGSRPAR